MPPSAPKKPRKAPETRGLVVRLRVDVSDRLRKLAGHAGITTKEELEGKLAEWLEGQLGPFEQDLAARARAEILSLLKVERQQDETVAEVAP